ncbi:MAG: hypothetical protein WBI17_10355 [Clostridiaceae bacterium]
MASKEITGSIETEVLFDHNNNPSYLIGYSDVGYMIIDRATGKSLERSPDGKNPYEKYPELKKYYGGLLLYYIETNKGLYDIVNDKIVGSANYVVKLSEETEANVINKNVSTQLDAIDLSNKSITSVTYTKTIYNADTYVRRQAFGNNTTGTCSAVACGIALNYLDKSFNSNVVPTAMNAENLVGYDYFSQSYPKATALHYSLVNTYYMLPMSYADGIRQPIDLYRNGISTVTPTGIAVQWSFFNNNTSYITNQLDLNKPAMITTTLFAGSYNFHTMAVYGYNILSDGSIEY